MSYERANYRRVTAEVSLRNLIDNVKAVRGLMPGGVKLLASVKADAYGHGAEAVSKTLLENGADALGVAICEEGLALRECNIDAPVLVFGFTPEPLLDEVVRRGLTQTVFSAETARALDKAAARLNMKADVHIKIDTGMGRLGFPPDEASAEAVCGIAALPNIRVTGIYTHLATSDALENGFMFEQYARFTRLLGALENRGLRIPARHMMNSGALAQALRTDMSGFFMDMARTGILLYGLPPSAEMSETCLPLGLKQTMRLITQVSMVKTLPAGAGVSYGHMFTAGRETRVATLPVGYADGYPRRLSNRGRVLIKQEYAPIIGAICMDQCMIDVTDIPGVAPGDEAVLLGAQGDKTVSADELAGIVGTISYEITCGIGKRVPRAYV